MVYLKSIDAYGFKSFADQTHVQFDKGVTAIVGPNGSGKSNITDAIKWVLGEQSAKSLRGGKMEDIIFSGAEHRKSLNYAEVQLKLDNKARRLNLDIDDVTVTRRLYRTGESEYYLNNDRARLKDITDLFLDSGLGKEAFSIISQGRVDEILNAKPIDRRQIIEESAGVLKYKKRKAASVQKLDQTEDNLSRVEDILYDLEGRVEPLREEAAIAKEYQHLAQEMKRSDILVTTHDIEQYHQSIHERDTQLNRLKGQQAQKEQDKVSYTHQLNDNKSKRMQLDQDIERINAALVHATEAVEKYTGQRNVLEERKKNQSETNARFEEEQAQLESRLASLEQEREQAKTELERLKAQKQTLVTTIEEMEQTLYVTDEQHEEKLEAIKDEYYTLMTQQSELNNDIRFLEHTIQENEAKQSRLDSRLVDAYKALKDIQADIHRVQTEQQEAQQALEACAKQCQAYERELSKVKASQTEYESQLYKAYRYNEKLKSRIDGLAMRDEEYANFYAGVKQILKAKGQTLQGIHGAVAEVIQVPSKLTKAIETALGASLQHIIVETEKDGRQAIQYLKQQQLGRATFLPLNVIQPRYIAQDIQQTAQQTTGFVQIASEAVDYDQTYTAIVKNLLGNTIIVENLEHANGLARAIRYRTRIVTLDGDIVNPGGSMTGGGQKQNQSILSQKDELNTLKSQLASYQAQTSEYETLVQQKKQETDALSEAYLQENQRYNALKQREHDVALELDRLKKNEAHLKAEHEEFEFEKNDGYQSDVSRKTLDEKRQTLTDVQAQLEKLESDITRYTALSKQDKASATQQQQALHQKQSDLAVVNERLKTQKTALQRIAQQNEQATAERARLVEQIELFNSDEVTGEAAFARIEQDIAKHKEERATLTTQLEEAKTKRAELHEAFEALDATLQEIHRDMLSIETNYQDIKSEQSRLDVLINHAIDHLSETYQLTYERATSLYELNEDIEQLRKKVKLTKMSIEELGPVNMNAIEQFEEVNERYTFLDEQRNDLRAAKETLETIIAEMDQEVSERFKQTFTAVQSHFTDVFKTLFGGGQASLELTGDDYLTAGVDIIVQPPGKKLQHLSLLSGGERALSAIALLFALLKVRSAPFVILDEVEAALDEANVIRYAQYLKQLSDKTQFIVITHRKGTMEYSDRLYGVTMQESGVSKLVSVNLNTINEVMEEEQI